MGIPDHALISSVTEALGPLHDVHTPPPASPTMEWLPASLPSASMALRAPFT